MTLAIYCMIGIIALCVLGMVIDWAFEASFYNGDQEDE